jgi:hypothetical protein
MLPDVETLLTWDEVTLRPASGAFDVAKIAAAIEGIGFPFRDSADPSRFVITASPESRDQFQARRAADPKSGLPFVPIVAVGGSEVTVSPIANHPALRDISAEFLNWLTSEYACELVEGQDTPPSGGDDARA